MNEATGVAGWIPYQLLLNDETLSRWMYVGNKQYTEPFFYDTISACKHFAGNTARIKCVSTLDFLQEAATGLDAVKPSVFIFHVSRCGSTLASQLFSLNYTNIVLSEVPFFDELLRWQHKLKFEVAPGLQLVKAAIDFYAQKRNGNENKLVIKTDSWHVLFYKQLRILYPNTPFVLLYRKPAEVIRSHQKRRGMQAVPGLIEPSIFGFDAAEIIHTPLDEYMAKVLEKYFEAFINILDTDANAFAINYNEGAIAMAKKIADIAGIALTEKDWAQIKERTGYHAKYPEQTFYEEDIVETVPSYLSKSVNLYNLVEMRRSF